ncbi:MAG: Gfo/Idh/MocA family protein [Solirubrobacteraceae bacterium]
MTVHWGILSTARINDKFIVGCAQSDAMTIGAVASRDGERARSYADEHGIERAHASYDALLDDAEIEAVYISLPNSMHLEWTERALRAGKHVLCEKPLGRRADEVAAAFDLADRQGLLLMEAFMYRHNPQTERIAELIRSGAIGRLRLIRAAFSFGLEDSSDVRLSTGLDGGALMDVGCYCVSAARMLAGEPEHVSAQQVLGGDGVDVVFTGTMSFADEVLAHFDAGLVLAARDELELVGDTGSLFLDDPWHCRTPVIEVRTAGGVDRVRLPRVDSYRREVENLSAAIRGEAEPLLGRADAVGQAAAIEALYAAAESRGTPVTRHE